MSRTRTGVSIGAVGLAAALAVGVYSYNQYQKQASLQQGIMQTQHSLQEVSQLLADNQADLHNLAGNVLKEFALPDSALKDSIDLLDVWNNSFHGQTAWQDQDYLKATGQFAEVIAAVWGKVNPWVDVGTKAVDAAADYADYYEAQCLLAAQVQLLQVQSALEQQLSHLEGQDLGQAFSQSQILNNLYGDPAAWHAAFLQWLAAHGLSEKEVLAKALSNASASGPGTSSRAALGISIIDPSQVPDLSGIEGINPDFIAALKCESDGIQNILNGGNGMVGVGCARCRAGDPCNRYPDGSYINAFGPPAYDPTRSVTGGGSDATVGLFRSQKPAPSAGPSQSGNPSRAPMSPAVEVNAEQDPIIGTWDGGLVAPGGPKGELICSTEDRYFITPVSPGVFHIEEVFGDVCSAMNITHTGPSTYEGLARNQSGCAEGISDKLSLNGDTLLFQQRSTEDTGISNGTLHRAHGQAFKGGVWKCVHR